MIFFYLPEGMENYRMSGGKTTEKLVSFEVGDKFQQKIFTKIVPHLAEWQYTLMSECSYSLIRILTVHKYNPKFFICMVVLVQRHQGPVFKTNDMVSQQDIKFF